MYKIHVSFSEKNIFFIFILQNSKKYGKIAVTINCEVKRMIIAIDIGNTNITIGGFTDDNPSFVAHISTDASKTSDEYAQILTGIFSLHNKEAVNVSGAVIASVVPPLNEIIRKAVKFVFGVDALIIAPGIKTGVNIHCDVPSTVGADIICACAACGKLHSSPAIIIDMGTATKIMAIDKSGAFIGVSIIPGVTMGLKALSEGTAQLPQVSLDAPNTVIGKNTSDCMKSGVIFGNASMIDGMIERFFEEIGEDTPVFATGGLSSVIIPHCRHKITIDDSLVLKGLNIIYRKNH